MNRTRAGSWMIAIAVLPCGVAAGQEAQATGGDVERVVPALEFKLTPGVWMPRLGGEVKLGSSPAAANIDLGGQLDLDDWEPTFNAELTIRKREVWQVRLGGFDFETSSSGTFVGNSDFGSLSLSNGDPFSATFEITSFFVEVDVALWRPYADKPGARPDPENITSDGRYVADLRFSPRFGIQYLDVDQTLVQTGVGREAVGGEWVGVYGGLNVELQYRPVSLTRFLEMIALEGGVALGPALGGDGGIIWTVRGGLTTSITKNFGLMVGYRLVELDVEDGDYELDGGLQGLFFAGSLQF
ncbi:MAG: hypothetical protein ACYSXF_08395 [Planctomycetota bacterium]